MQRTVIGALATAALVLGASGCGIDGPSAPSRSAAGPQHSLAITPRARSAVVDVTSMLDTVLVLRRVAPLRADVSSSADIGPQGGDIHIPAAGATIHFPAGALAVTTTITMTATAGWDVAYEFAPHGIRFAEPVTIEQDLRGTLAGRFRALLPGLQGSYYDQPLDDSFVDPWHMFATVRENLPGKADPRTMEFRFQIHHFSGYLVSSGRR